MSRAMIELSGINKVYDKEVLKIDKLHINKGVIYGIIGPSGAGKSTLLRILNLLTPQSEGSYLYNGKPIPGNGKELLELQQKMSLVFQKPLLFRDTVFNNVAFGLKARKYSRSEIDIKVSELLDQVGLKELSERRADTLSGGEAQRVAIARAIAFDPELLLLDEPTANLDPGNVELIEDMISKMSRQKSITVVMVTHNIFQARRIADEVIYIDKGEIVEMGATQKVFNDPANDRTRLYIEGRLVY